MHKGFPFFTDSTRLESIVDFRPILFESFALDTCSSRIDYSVAILRDNLIAIIFFW